MAYNEFAYFYDEFNGEADYGIPELQAVLNAAVAAEYEANAEDAE